MFTYEPNFTVFKDGRKIGKVARVGKFWQFYDTKGNKQLQHDDRRELQLLIERKF
jgi:hypothetical protein